jgi:C_GCAxxG_C_C family probable redox protein
VAVGQKKLAIKDKYLVRAMTSISGGVAASGGMCGALVGGVAFLGSVLGRDEPEKKDDPVLWKACHMFYSRLEKETVAEHAGINCRDISGVTDWRDRDQQRAFYKGEGIIKCQKNVGKAARILCEVIEKYINREDISLRGQEIGDKGKVRGNGL